MSPEPLTTVAWQHAFAARVRDPVRAPLPPGATARRMAVYEELLFNNLEGFLLACYPVTRRLLGARSWRRAVRAFFRQHPCRSPLFRDIPKAFLDWITPLAAARYPARPWLADLMHYEELELEVSVLAAEPPEAGIDPAGDLLTGRPALHPASRLACYRYPVHRISPRFKPDQEDPSCYLLYRQADEMDEAGGDAVRFILLTPLAARLLALLRHGQASGREALAHLAGETAADQYETFLTRGGALLAELRRQGALLGTWREP